jgi:hypothetical protein
MTRRLALVPASTLLLFGRAPLGAPAEAVPDLQPPELWRAHVPLPGNGPKDLGELAGPFYYVDYPELRAALARLYDEFHVDLVLQGHDHAYPRSHPVRSGRIAGAGEQGTTYLIAVSGSKMYEIDTPHAGLMKKMLTRVQSYQVIAVDGGTLQFQSYSADGQSVDAFELTKH